MNVRHSTNQRRIDTAKRAGKFCTLKCYHQAWHAFSEALANDRGDICSEVRSRAQSPHQLCFALTEKRSIADFFGGNPRVRPRAMKL
jgi:hypothetical protein